ncbi:hypothetical protein AOLI_G00151420 [Acnodon oligacanthus]
MVGDVVVKVGSTLCSCFLLLYRIIFRIVQNPMLDHFVMLAVLFDVSTLMSQTFQGVTVRTGMVTSFPALMSVGGFSSRQASTLFRVLKILKGARVFQNFISAESHTEMFNESDPEHFGNIFRTIFTLFQILTLDDWSLIYMTSRDNGAGSLI